MHRAAILSLSLATASLISARTPATAQDQPTADQRRDEYFVAAGKTYNAHAHDHARMLVKHAAASGDQPVSPEVVKEHTAAIKTNIDRASASYSRLSDSARKNSNVARHLADIEARLVQVTAQLDSLEKASTTNVVASKLLVDRAATIAQELRAAHRAGHHIRAALLQRADAAAQSDRFDNSQSPRR